MSLLLGIITFWFTTQRPSFVCLFSFSCLPLNNWLILAQRVGPCVKAAEGTA
jgi:hypothetical protein